MRSRWVMGLRAVVAAAALAYCFQRFGVREILANLGAVSALGALAVFATALAGHLLGAWRLGLLAHRLGWSLTPAEMVSIQLGPLFYGLALPGGSVTATAIRYYKLARSSRSHLAAASVLICDRAFGVLTLALVGTGCWIADPLRRFGAVASMLALVGISATAVLGGLAWRQRPLARAYAGTLLLTLAAQFLGWMAFVLAARAMGLELSAWSLGWIRSAMVVAAMLPISVAGLGVREGAAVALLGTFGLPGEEALAFSLLVFALTNLAVGATGGAVEAARWVTRRPSPRGTV
jgi:hypothetical protein